MKTLYLDQTAKLGGGEIALLPWLIESRAEGIVALFEDGPFRLALQQQGVDVHILDSGDLARVRRESSLLSGLGTIPAFLRLRKQVARLARSVDVVYANSMKSLLVAAVARRRGQPLVWHLRDILSDAHFSPSLRRLVVAVANRMVSAVIANSHATADAFVAAGGNPAKLTVVYDGVSETAFAPIGPAALDLLRHSIAPAGRPLIGVFSRISPWKGQDILLEALSAIPGADLVIVGDALFGEHQFADQLKRRASQPDLAGRVHFLGFRQDVPAIMQCVDIVAHTSVAPEPFGLVILEGMLAGKPVIASRGGGAIEIIGSPAAGILVTPRSVSELRDTIAALLADPVLATRMAHAGRTRAQQAFPLSATFDGISAVLRKLTPPAKTPQSTPSLLLDGD